MALTYCNAAFSIWASFLYIGHYDLIVNIPSHVQIKGVFAPHHLRNAK
jgi:hypothetical protein